MEWWFLALGGCLRRQTVFGVKFDLHTSHCSWRFTTKHLHRMGAAFLNVACCVTYLLRCALAHENVDTQGWQSPLRREFHRLLIACKIFLSGVLTRTSSKPAASRRVRVSDGDIR